MGLFFYQKMMLGCEEVWWRWRLLMMESYRILKEFGGTFWFGLKGFFLLIVEKWEILKRDTNTNNNNKWIWERRESISIVCWMLCCVVNYDVTWWPQVQSQCGVDTNSSFILTHYFTYLTWDPFSYIFVCLLICLLVHAPPPLSNHSNKYEIFSPNFTNLGIGFRSFLFTQFDHIYK